VEAPSSAELAPLGMPGARHLIEYHVVTNGACWADTVNGEMEPIRLNRGSLIIFPRGEAHVLSSAPRMRAAPDLRTDAEISAAVYRIAQARMLR